MQSTWAVLWSQKCEVLIIQVFLCVQMHSSQWYTRPFHLSNQKPYCHELHACRCSHVNLRSTHCQTRHLPPVSRYDGFSHCFGKLCNASALPIQCHTVSLEVSFSLVSCATSKLFTPSLTTIKLCTFPKFCLLTQPLSRGHLQPVAALLLQLLVHLTLQAWYAGVWLQQQEPGNGVSHAIRSLRISSKCARRNWDKVVDDAFALIKIQSQCQICIARSL